MEKIETYNNIVKMWERLYAGHYVLKNMPFFQVIVDVFLDNNALYITAEEMKNLINHYKKAFNLFKNEIRYKEFSIFPGFDYYYLRRSLQREYQHMLRIYEHLLNIEDMTNGKIYTTTRTTTKTNR